MMVSPNSKTLCGNDFTSFVDFIRPYEIESIDLAEHYHSTSTLNTIVYKCEGFDDELPYYITYMISEKTVIIDDENTVVESSAVITRDFDDTAWFIPEDKVKESKYLPELHQSFHEGDFTERDANYKYHFWDGETMIAKESANPVQRPDETYLITEIERVSDFLPKKWRFKTGDDETLYLRERSGSIRVYKEVEVEPEDRELLGPWKKREKLFRAYVGEEHPGTNLHDEEIIGFIQSLRFMNFSEELRREKDYLCENTHPPDSK